VSAPNERMSDEALEVARFCECLTHRTALSEEAKRARAAELALGVEVEMWKHAAEDELARRRNLGAQLEAAQAEVEMVTQQRDAERGANILLREKLNMADRKVDALCRELETRCCYSVAGEGSKCFVHGEQDAK
jgi:hypothetical protein